MHIDWATLGAIAIVAAAAALTTVLLVALALVATSGTGKGNAARTRIGGTAVAGLCLLSAGLIVSYGLYLIIA
jgi:hypothetical protein